MKGFVSTAEAAQRLEVTPTRIRQMIAEGVVRESEKFGRDLFIPEAEIKRLESIERGPGRPAKTVKK